MRLEQLESVTQERRDACQALAFKIFMRFKPKNPGIPENRKMKGLSSYLYLPMQSGRSTSQCAPAFRRRHHDRRWCDTRRTDERRRRRRSQMGARAQGVGNSRTHMRECKGNITAIFDTVGGAES